MDIHDFRKKEKLKQRLHAQFSAWLEQHEMKQTAGRFLILDKCVDQRPHFGIQHLYDEIRGKHPISLASVYKTVELLCDCGVLRKHHLREKEAVYEIAGEEHLHLICVLCGDVAVLAADRMTESQKARMSAFVAARGYRSFSPSYITANVYGICGACRARS